MTSLRLLPNIELLRATSQLAYEERRITLAVLTHFREIERRKAYSDLGFKSLFEYAVTHLRYSEGSASRRIAAMHALKEQPELAEKIQGGKASVTSIARIHTVLRRDEKLSGEKRSTTEKKDVFQTLSALPSKELERKLFELAPQGAIREVVRPVAANLHELKIFLNSEELAALDELKGLYAHSLKDSGSYSEIFRKLIEIGKLHQSQIFRRPSSRLSSGRKPSGQSASRSVGQERTSSPQTKLKPVASPLTESGDTASPHPNARRDASPLAGENRTPSPPKSKRRLTATVRRSVFIRARFRCEFFDSNGKRCDSNHHLQIEHRTPYALGGSSDLKNLELLCRDHNLIRGIRAFGPKKMRRT